MIMMQKPASCKGCPLFNIGTGFSITEGRCSNGVLIIGESLGANEVNDAMPFRPHAEAGSALQAAFRFLGLDRTNFGLWNMIGCQPPFNNLENAEYEYEAIDHCKVHFDRVVAKFKPKVILALGNVPLKHLWKRDPKIDEYISLMPEDTKEEKKAKRKYLSGLKIGQLRGYTFDSVYGIPLIASFHPSFITQQKGRTQLGTLMNDITKAINIARNGVPKFDVNYIEDPSIEDCIKFYEECKADPNLVISHDIETPITTIEVDESEIEYENIEVREIDSVQFSYNIRTGIYIPHTSDDYNNIIGDILALPNSKIGWNNWKFDEINLEYHYGKGSVKGENHDIMWMWKWLNQDFIKTGRALQFATPFFAPDFPAWKFYAQIYPKRYGVQDVDATLRIYEGLKKFLSSKKLANVTAKTLYEGYMDDIVYLRPILKDMTKRGFPIDVEAREIFTEQIILEQQKVLAELQDMYPMKLRRLDPLEGYKTIPKEVIHAEELFKRASDFRGSGLYYVLDDNSNNDLYNLRLAQYIERHSKFVNKKGEVDDTMSGLVLKEFNIEGFKTKRWCRMEEFKPGSSQQVLNYLNFKGYKIPKKRTKKGQTDTTSKDHLMPLWEETGDPLLYKTIYLRELDHLLGYVGKGKGKGEGWKIGSDNRVHAEFLYIPVTGQLSSSPNIQNAPARGTRYSSEGYENLAKLFRKTVAAGVGKTLVSADWSAFHINTLAFEAEDETYMRVGRLDPHSYLTAYMLQNSLPAKIAKLKLKKPSGADSTLLASWLEECEIGDEAIERIKTIDTWMARTDDGLKTELSWFKKHFKFERDAQAKRALLGMGFGMQVNRFYRENRHAFTSKTEPERILKLIKKLFPKTFVDYHEYIKNLADKQTYLLTRYGYIRRFYDVYDWRIIPKLRPVKDGELLIKNSKGQLWLRKDGASSNEAIAYLPANDAFGKKKEAMRDLWNHPNGNLVQAFGLINEIHDDLMFEIDDGLLYEALPIIKNVMESPARYLKNSLAPNGLITRVEIKIGKNWAEMQEVKV